MGKIENYPIFVLVALVPWQFLTGTLSSGTQSVVANGSLVKKVYFPRIILPLTAVLSNFVNFLFAFLMIVVMLYVFGIGLTVHAFWVPLIMVTQLIFMIGLVMILSTLNTFYRDVTMILQVVTLAWFFLTPIFYPFEELVNRVSISGVEFNGARVMRWVNPMASIVDGYRTVLWGKVDGGGPGGMDPLNLIRTLVTSLLVFLIGYIIFTRAEHLFGERL